VTARDDYPNIDSIAAGHGMKYLEDAEEEALLALSELDALRPIAMAAWAWRACKNAQHANTSEASRRHYDSVRFAERHLSEKLDNLIAFAEEDARIRWVHR